MHTTIKNMAKKRIRYASRQFHKYLNKKVYVKNAWERDDVRKNRNTSQTYNSKKYTIVYQSNLPLVDFLSLSQNFLSKCLKTCTIHQTDQTFHCNIMNQENRANGS